jgi:transcription factor C subunit 7
MHSRVASILAKIISALDSDPSGPRSVIICAHAAIIIAAGRALTGNMPDSYEEHDFHTFTCGVSRFERRIGPQAGLKGIGGGWDCTLNSYCGFLSGGEERGWYISGEESFVDFSTPSQEQTTKDQTDPSELSPKNGSSKL